VHTPCRYSPRESSGFSVDAGIQLFPLSSPLSQPLKHLLINHPLLLTLCYLSPLCSFIYSFSDQWIFNCITSFGLHPQNFLIIRSGGGKEHEVRMLHFCLFVQRWNLFPILIRIYSLYRGIYCDNKLYIVHWLDHPTISPTNPSPLHLKWLQEVSSFYFTYASETHQPYSLTFISFIHLPVPTSIPPYYRFTVLSH
jgi:hypothetical protein